MKLSNETSIAFCNVEFAEEFFGHEIPKDRYGYRRVGEKFVPKSLLERIEDHLGCTTFGASSVHSPREMVGKKFWKSLYQDEQDVLADCLFLLIAEGRITFHVPE